MISKTKRRRKPRVVKAHCTRLAQLDSFPWPSKLRSNSKRCDFIRSLTKAQSSLQASAATKAESEVQDCGRAFRNDQGPSFIVKAGPRVPGMPASLHSWHCGPSRRQSRRREARGPTRDPQVVAPFPALRRRSACVVPPRDLQFGISVPICASQ